MTHILMNLPFDENALEPYISKETMQYHHGKHHAGYVNKLNTLIKGTPYEDLTLEEVIKQSEGSIFNNASQVYNHDLYFKGMDKEKSEPSKMLRERIDRDFGSMEKFKTLFLDTAANLFGSGWVWLCIDKEGSMAIESYSNADNLLVYGLTPLMTCDVWEHAYYIDYRNVRAAYLEKWWEVINWNFVSTNLANYQYIEFPCDDYSGACDFKEEE